jgi:hypothetical protein
LFAFVCVFNHKIELKAEVDSSIAKVQLGRLTNSGKSGREWIPAHNPNKQTGLATLPLTMMSFQPQNSELYLNQAKVDGEEEFDS